MLQNFPKHYYCSKASQKDQKLTLFDILIPYPVRKCVLQHISAYDAAKLDLSLGRILTSAERKLYLNPVRDLLWNVPEMEELSREGMKLLLLGADAPALEQRLHTTKQYLEAHSNRRKLKIYLIGTFPILGKSATVLDRMVHFSITGDPSKSRTLRDQYQLRRIEQRMMASDPDAEKPFLMAFSAPVGISTKETKGLWYRVPNVPESTVDLYVYVPCLDDRTREEVRVPRSEILHFFGSSRASALRAWKDVFHIFTGRCQLKTTYLTASGIRKVDVSAQEQLLVRFGNLLPSVHVRY
jgi:hypothetical protein